MRLTIACVGRLRAGPALDLYRDYIDRLPWPVSLKEVEERKPLSAPERVDREAALLRQAIPDRARLVALDETGKQLGSTDFARRLGRWIDDGASDLAFLIGGADGLAPDLRKQADLVLSLGLMTWPHLLVRGMLAEQLYRASSILAGHPYHRG